MTQVKSAYLVTVVGVVLMTITTIYSDVRALMFRAMFRPGGFSGNGGFNGTEVPGGGFSGARPFGGGGFGFGLTNYVTLLGLIIVIVGVVWLGLELRKTPKK
ncbi:MAG: hypothetical protein ABSF63_11400 [Candidatus Bathyarchaeia archaeon]|jgi:hypothetical protein